MNMILSEESLNILIANLSLKDYAKVMGDISKAEDNMITAVDYMKHNATSNYFDKDKNMFRREIDILEILERR